MAGLPKRAMFFRQDGTGAPPANPTESGYLLFDPNMSVFELMVSGGTALARAAISGATRRLSAVNNSAETVADFIRAVSPLVAGESSPGAAGIGGILRLRAPNDAGTLKNVGLIQWVMTTVTAGAEVGTLALQAIQAGVGVTALLLSPTTTDGETFAVLAGRLGGAAVTRRVLIGADTTGPGGANRALYVAT